MLLDVRPVRCRTTSPVGIGCTSSWRSIPFFSLKIKQIITKYINNGVKYNK